MLLKAIPLLPAFDINKTIDFYEYKLGFTSFNYGNYLVLKYKTVELHFYYTKDKVADKANTCYILVDNVEDLYGSFSIKELVEPKRKLQDMPWGTREFSVVDNNGNVIRFGQKK